MPVPGPRTERLVLGGVRVTHPERRLFQRPPLTKGEVARFYAEAAPLLLPHIAGRPLGILRCPDGVESTCFFQRHPMPGMAEGVATAPAGAGKEPYLSVDSLKGLMTLVQFGAIELHPGGARKDRPDRPDRLVFDLDPGPGVAWAATVAAAHELRERLDGLGLQSFCKTTGGKGLHVVVPIERRHPWPAAKAFAKAVATAMATDDPARFTATLAKAVRKGRIFIDYLRNDDSASAVAPYSLRARAGATVAMPLAWTEVTPELDPSAFDARTALEHARGRPDPWADLAGCRQRLPAGLTA